MFWISRAYQLSVHPTLDHRPLPPIIENMHLWNQKANVAHVFKQTTVKHKTRTDVCYKLCGSLKGLIVIKEIFYIVSSYKLKNRCILPLPSSGVPPSPIVLRYLIQNYYSLIGNNGGSPQN
jgi:hypothetical protein